jgi:hypothetical protein
VNVDKLAGLMRWSEGHDEVIIVVDGYEYVVDAVELDERLGHLYLKASETPEDDDEVEEEDEPAGPKCNLTEPTPDDTQTVALEA